MKNINKHRRCPICGETIKKLASESWPTYDLRKSCSTRCAARLRQREIRERKDGHKMLELCLTEWSATDGFFAY